jgi:hypothetical protein
MGWRQLTSVYRYLRGGRGSIHWRVAWVVLSCLVGAGLSWVITLAGKPHGPLWPRLVIGGVLGVAIFLFAYPGLSELVRDRRGGWIASWEKRLSRPDGSTGVKHADGTTEYEIQLRAVAEAHGGAKAEVHRKEANDPADRAE